MFTLDYPKDNRYNTYILGNSNRKAGIPRIAGDVWRQRGMALVWNLEALRAVLLYFISMGNERYFRRTGEEYIFCAERLPLPRAGRDLCL
jgi:hypothetical protein